MKPEINDKIVSEVTAKVKALTDADGEMTGEFEAYASTYDTDSVKDKVVPGAFANSLKTWNDSGRKIPLLWSHDTKDPFSFIGDIDHAEETDQGLYVKGHFDLDGSNPKAVQIHKLVKGGRVSQLSFMYGVKDYEYVGDKKAENDGAEVLLKELDIFEVTLCHLGANQNTRIISAKEADSIEIAAGDVVEVSVKAGAALSSANRDKIKTALQSIQDALESLEAITGVTDSDDASTDGKSTTQENQPTKTDDETHAKVNTDEPETKSAEEVRSVPVNAMESELERLALGIY